MQYIRERDVLLHIRLIIKHDHTYTNILTMNTINDNPTTRVPRTPVQADGSETHGETPVTRVDTPIPGSPVMTSANQLSSPIDLSGAFNAGNPDDEPPDLAWTEDGESTPRARDTFNEGEITPRPKKSVKKVFEAAKLQKGEIADDTTDGKTDADVSEVAGSAGSI